MIVISYRIKRIQVRWRRFRRSFDKKISPSATAQPSPYQEKGIRLWRYALKDKDSRLGISTHGVRQVERGNILLLHQLGEGNSDSVLTIIDVREEGNNIYEMHMQARQSQAICHMFDEEMDKRMSIVETAKRAKIETDLDELVREQDARLRAQKNK